jgi:hypothetical protein
MARDYGKLYIRTWSDPDFIALPSSAQRTYMFLMSQPDLSNAGTITVALRRWAHCVGDEDADGILSDLRILAAKRYVIVDMGCEELLIRSYIRWDGGWRSPNMMVSIKAAASQALSPTIRASIREEIKRLDTSTLPAKVNERTGRSTREFIELIIGQLEKTLDRDLADPEVLGFGDAANHSGNRCGRHGVIVPHNPSPNPLRKGSLTTTTTTTTTAIDTTATAIEQPSPLTGRGAEEPRPLPTDEEIDQWEPKQSHRQKAMALADKGYPLVDIDDLSEEYKLSLQAKGIQHYAYHNLDAAFTTWITKRAKSLRDQHQAQSAAIDNLKPALAGMALHRSSQEPEHKPVYGIGSPHVLGLLGLDEMDPSDWRLPALRDLLNEGRSDREAMDELRQMQQARNDMEVA